MKNISGWKELSEAPVSVINVALSCFIEAEDRHANWEDLREFDYDLEKYLGGRLLIVDTVREAEELEVDFIIGHKTNFRRPENFDVFEKIDGFLYIFLATNDAGGDAFFIKESIARALGVWPE